jgi:hypothetical protein
MHTYKHTYIYVHVYTLVHDHVPSLGVYTLVYPVWRKVTLYAWMFTLQFSSVMAVCRWVMCVVMHTVSPYIHIHRHILVAKNAPAQTHLKFIDFLHACMHDKT